MNNVILDASSGRALPFPFGALAGRLKTLAMPDGPFDPAAAWTHRYDIVHMMPPCAPIGYLTIEGRPGEDGSTRLRVVQMRPVSGVEAVAVEADMVLARDELATPRSWTLFSRLRRDNAPVAESKLKRECRLEGGRLTVVTGNTRRVREAPGPAALSWALFDAVQRLPAKAADPLKFTLIDEFEEVKPGQSLRYRGPCSLDIPGREGPLALELFDRTGPGDLPHVYARDRAGRLAVVVTGLLAYIGTLAPAVGTGGTAAKKGAATP